MKNPADVMVDVWLTPVAYKIWKKELDCEERWNGSCNIEVFSVENTPIENLVINGLTRTQIIGASEFTAKKVQTVHVGVKARRRYIRDRGMYLSRDIQRSINKYTVEAARMECHRMAALRYRIQGIPYEDTYESWLDWYDFDFSEINKEVLRKERSRKLKNYEFMVSFDNVPFTKVL